MSVNSRFKPGSIHVYKTPFVDGGQSKPRPVLITTLPNSKGEVLGIPGTSQIQNWAEENALVINPNDLAMGHLHKTAVFPVSKQMWFSPRFFCGEVGTINDATLDRVLRMVIAQQVEQFSAVTRMPKEFVPGESVIPPSGKVIGAEELKNMVDASLDGWLTTGRFNDAFESRFSEFVGAPYVLTTNSGSSANLLAMAALTSPKLGNKALKPGDEVITVAAAFPTTVNPIIQMGLVPVFVDIQIPSYNIDPAKIEAAISSKTRAIMLAHTLGNPFDLDAVMAIANKYDLWVVEDCCDALGSTYKGQHVGTFGHIGTCSFYPAHQITMGEGGAVFTKDRKLKKIIESFRDWGRDCYCAPGHDDSCGMRFGWQLGDLPKGYDHKYTYSHLGYNLKITDMQAAVGLAQLSRLPEFIRDRHRNFDRLKESLKSCEDFLILPHPTTGSNPCWFGFPVTLSNSIEFNRIDLLKLLTREKIGVRLLFAGNLTRQPYMTNKEYRIVGDLDCSDFVMKNTFWIGVYPGLTGEMLDHVVKAFELYFGVKK